MSLGVVNFFKVIKVDEEQRKLLIRPARSLKLTGDGKRLLSQAMAELV